MGAEGWREPESSGTTDREAPRELDPYAPPAETGTATPPQAYVPPGYGTPPAHGTAPGYGTAPAYGTPTAPGTPPAYGTPQAYGPPGVPPQPQYGGQPYGYPPYGYAPGPQRTSGLAIAGFVLGLVWIYWIGSILAVIFGHLALNETKRDPRVGGRGFAIAALVLGYLGLGILVLGIVALVASGGSSTGD